ETNGRRPTQTRPGDGFLTVAVGYVRVSTDEQGSSGLGLSAQRHALEEEATRRGWSLAAVYEDIASGKTKNGRRGFEAAVQAVNEGEADVLVAVRVDRLSRSLRDLIDLMDRSVSEGWSLVTL